MFHPVRSSRGIINKITSIPHATHEKDGNDSMTPLILEFVTKWIRNWSWHNAFKPLAYWVKEEVHAMAFIHFSHSKTWPALISILALGNLTSLFSFLVIHVGITLRLINAANYTTDILYSILEEILLSYKLSTLFEA